MQPQKAAIDRFDPPSKQQLLKVELEARAKTDKEHGQILLMTRYSWLVKHFQSYKRRHERYWH